MKINLTMNGKQFHDPLFDILNNHDKTKFLFGVRHNVRIDYSFIRDEFVKNFISLKIEKTSFIFETKEKIFLFNTRERFSLLPKNKDLKLSVVLLGEDGKVNYLALMVLRSGLWP